MFRLSRNFGLKRVMLGVMMLLLVFSPVHSMTSVVSAQEESETMDIPVQKIWEGEEGDQVTVTLVGDGEHKEKMDLFPEDDWSYVFEDVPITNPDGNEIDYTIIEAPVEGYESEVTGSAEDGFTVINRQIEEDSNRHMMYIQKTWKDEGPENRPDSVSFVVSYPIGEETKEDIIELDSETGEIIRAENEWGEISLDNIDYDYWAVDDGFQFEAKVAYKKEDGNLLVTEVPIDGYETTVDQDGNYFNFTNTAIVQEPETMDIPVTKVWEGEEGDLVTVTLVGDGEDKEKMDLHVGNDWSYVFENVPVTNPDGSVIDYTVTEAPVDGYETEVTGSAEDGFTVINKQIDDEDYSEMIYIQKKWVDDSENRPETVTFIMEFALGDEYVEVVKLELNAVTGELLSVEEKWEDEWESYAPDIVDYYDYWEVEDGFQFEIRVYPDAEDELNVREQPIDGYETTVDRDGKYFNFTNTAVEDESEMMDITVTKEWEGTAQDEARAYLLINGQPYEEIVAVMNEENDWTFTFENMPVDLDGEAIEYGIDEEPIEGYDVSVSGNAEDGFVIVNREQEEAQPGNDALVLSKEWDDASNENRPDTLTFTVISATDYVRILDVMEVDAETGEIVDFRYQYIDDNGDAISDWIEAAPLEGFDYIYIETENGFEFQLDYYGEGVVFESVEEAAVEGYESTIDIDGVNVSVINAEVVDDPPAEEETIDITVTKEWVGKKQDSATVYLVINGQRYEDGEVFLSEENDWTHTFEGFYESIDGYDFEFTIEEEEMEGYEVDITGNVEDGFVVTNTEIEEDPKKDSSAKDDPKENPEEKDDPKITVEAGDDGGQQLPKTATNMYNWIVVGVIILIVGMVVVVFSRRRKV